MRDKNRSGTPDTRAGAAASARTGARSSANTSATRAKEAGGKSRGGQEAPAAPAAKERAGGFAAEVEALRKELDERTSDLQRLTAEYANYRRRVDRDRALVVEQATGAVLSELLGVLDDVDRARNHGDLVGPFGAVAEQLNSVLSKLGLITFGEAGDQFDPSCHEAVAHSYSSKVDEPTCVEVFRRGYALGERLLRPALVAVAEPSDEDEPEPEPVEAEQKAEPEPKPKPEPAEAEQKAKPSDVEAVAAAAGVTAKEREPAQAAGKATDSGKASKPGGATKSGPAAEPAGTAEPAGAGDEAKVVEPDVVDAEVVESEVVDAEVVDAEVVDAEVVEDEVVEGELVDAEASAVADQAEPSQAEPSRAEPSEAKAKTGQATGKSSAEATPPAQDEKSDDTSDDVDDHEAAVGDVSVSEKAAPENAEDQDASDTRKPQFRGVRSDTARNQRRNGTGPGKRDG